MFAKALFLPGRTWKFASRQRSISHPAPLDEFLSVENRDKGPTSSLESINPDLELPQRSEQTWGKKYILYLLIGLFIGLTVALMLIWHFNTKNHGFPVFVDNHYAWTYGPTAILVLVVSVWRQVDHHYKLVAPWTTLERGAALAKHSLLLDYISPIQLISFWQSLRNGHLSVTLTILGFFILKIITVVSTGVLVEESVVLPEKPLLLQLANRFNGNLYNETEFITERDASLVYTAYGVLAGGLDVQPGQTNSLVYQNFRTPIAESVTDASITAEVDAVIPEFNCEPATVSINPLPYGANGSRNGDTMIIVNPSCEMMGGEQPTFVLDVSSEICPPRQLRGVIQRVNCSMDANRSPFPNRQLLTLVEVEYNQTFGDQDITEQSDSTSVATNITSFALGIKRTKSLLCRPGYRRGRLLLTHHVSENTVNLTINNLTFDDSRIPGFLDEDLALMFNSALIDAASMFGELSSSRDAEEFPNTFFELMAAPHGGQYENLFDEPNTIQTAAEASFKQIAVQIISKNILGTDDAGVTGTVVLQYRRLIVNSISLWALVGGLIGMVIISFVLLLARMKQPTYPNLKLASIFGIAQVTARSQSLQEYLRPLALLPERKIAEELSQYHFFANPTGQRGEPNTLSITKSARSNTRPLDDHDNLSASEITWWQPLVSRRVVICLILLLPILTIIVLEILQVRSDSRRGILTIDSPNNTLTNAYSHFIPALVILSIATLFNAMDFNISVLAPFNAMRDHEAPPDRSIKASLIDKSPPMAIVVAIKSRYFAALASSVAAIIGSILTIIVSGLFTVQVIGRSDVVSVTLTDALDVSWNDSAINDRSASVFSSLTESLNLPYPKNTYDELAFPSFSIPSLRSNVSVLDTSELALTIPAFRANLDCTHLEKGEFNVSSDFNSRILTASASVQAHFPLPPSCPFGGPLGNESFIEVVLRIGFAQNSSYIGKLLDLHVGPYDPILGESFGESNAKIQRDNPAGCPTIALVYGFVDIEDESRTSVSTMMCYQQVQELNVNLTITLPSMEVSTTKPPIPDESSMKLLSSSTDGETTFPYRIQRHMDQSLSLFNQTKYASANLADSPVDSFFQGVLFGQHPLPESTLVGSQNQKRIMSAINAFYRRYMAQAISNNMRVARNADISPTVLVDTESSSLEGQITDFSGLHRLVQHKGSKLALQIMLSVMTLLGALACALTRLRDLVPHNPCTIFGVASLLAGSRLCSDENGELLREDENENTSSTQEPRHRLGWWDENNSAPSDSTPFTNSTELESEGAESLQRRRYRYGIDVIQHVE
ncbi:hypothetical protein B0A52_09151 [Exophiala mesophila]|uniref:Uncharacterized protein n=1 Tax=Exophiala mesophila TaxID=212818 RepID=A0A438MUF7_EXOME|nr:hypothetical protein B0A52_09151 [Exophiala mesophila]